MLSKLVASGGQKTRAWNSRSALVSLALHTLLLIGAVWATPRIARATVEQTEEEVTFVELQEEPATPEPPEAAPPPPPAETPATPPPPQGFQKLLPPETPPAEIPDVDLAQPPVRAEDFSGVGQVDGAAQGVTGGVPTNLVPQDSTPVFTVEETGVRPEILNLREVQRVLERNYPRQMADAGISGQVQVKFLIDEEGRVPASSITVVNASHEAFGEAAKRSVERFRFKPIVYHGAPVRRTHPTDVRSASAPKGRHEHR